MKRRLPNTQTLITFEASARHQSFSRAAEDLDLTQGAISRQIQTLEMFLSVRLFERRGGRVVLTAAGRQLQLELPPMLDGLETTMSRIGSRTAAPEPIRLATYPTLAARWFISRKMEFESGPGAPEIKIESISANADFDPGRHDLGILQGDPPWNGTTSRFLMAEELVVAGAPDFLKHREATIPVIARLPYLRHVTRPMSFCIWSQDAGSAQVEPMDGAIFDRYDMMIEAAAAGHGVGVFPKILIERELGTGLLSLIHPHVAVPSAAYHLVIPKTRTGPPSVQTFCDWLLATPN